MAEVVVVAEVVVGVLLVLVEVVEEVVVGVDEVESVGRDVVVELSDVDCGKGGNRSVMDGIGTSVGRPIIWRLSSAG